MNWVSGFAIYFIVWWTVLFAVLPFGVRNAAETGGTVGDGHDAGAPVLHGLRWKMGVTTVTSAVVFVLIYMLLNNGMESFENLPFYSDAPKV